jgi:hypothetical protein
MLQVHPKIDILQHVNSVYVTNGFLAKKYKLLAGVHSMALFQTAALLY